ncbi:MAG: PAS domain S-box protein, partial [Candidatus Cloacimonetes bacterium]|nr:PAS domain S-box protein [Candidatus Cloacimonadota bacterium]
GDFLNLNDRFCQMVGYSREEMLRLNISDITHPEDRELDEKYVGEVLAGKRDSFEIEKRYLHKNGNSIWIRLYSNVIRDSEGEAIYAIATVADITDRKRTEAELRENEEKLRKIIDLVPHFIFAKDENGRFILVNQAVADNYGTTVPELLGSTDGDFDPSETEVEHFLKDDREVMASGRRKFIPEETITDAAGNLHYLETTKIPFTYAGGRKAILGVSVDFTQRRKVELALARSEEIFRSLFEQSVDAVFLSDLQGHFIDVNNRAYHSLGLSRDELLQMNIEQVEAVYTTPEEVAEKINRLHDGETLMFESRHRRKDGSQFPVEVKVGLIKYGERFLVLNIARDISLRKEAEKALQDSEKRYRQLFEAANVGIGISDEDGTIHDANQALCDMLGYRKDQLLNLRSGILYHVPEDRNRIISAIREQGYILNYHTQMKRKTGEIIWVNMSIQPIEIHGANFLLSMMTDITLLKHAENAIRESEKKLNNIISHSHEMYYIHNTEHVLTYVSPQSMELFGYTEKEMMIRWTNLTTDNPINELGFEATQRAIDSGIRQPPYLLELKHKNGSRLWVEIDESPLKDENEIVIGMVGALRDISREYLARQALQESEEKYRTLFENAGQSIGYYSPEGRVISLNKVACDYLKGSSQEYIGRTPAEIFGEELGRKYETRIRKALKHDKTNHYEDHIMMPGGDRWFLSCYSGIRNAEGRMIGVQIISSDITDRKQAENKISSNLQEKEVMLQEIHHRVKNNLNIIVSLLHLQQSRITTQAQLETAFDDSINRIRSMALVHEKLYGSSELSVINFKEYIQEMVKDLLTAYNMEKTIQLDLQLTDVLLTINYAIPCGLILQELISNACKHAFCGLESALLTIILHKDSSDQIVLSVADNGKGLPADLDIHHTTSLGLQLVDILVRQMKGNLEIRCEQGTAFLITF